MKKNLFTVIMMLMPLAVLAQSGTNSPYSQYGLGILSDQTSGFNRGMNGLSMGMHEGNQVNYMNPASYSNMDSLTFILDAGASLQVTNFSEKGKKMNVQNANFDYAVIGFRAFKNVGVSLGIIPFANVGYNYYNKDNVSSTNTTSYTTTYYGDGGLRQAYFGIGAKPIKGLSVGANISYLWGNSTRYAITSYSDAYVNTVGRYYTYEVTDYKLDLGIQYTLKLGRKDNVTFGAVFTPGHKMSSHSDFSLINKNSQTNVSDTTQTKFDNALFLPTSFGGGVAWYHGTKWRVGADYMMQRWTDKAFPQFENGQYRLSHNALIDRHKFILGGEFVNNAMSRRYLNRVHVRAGLSYTTPYVKVNGQDGPKEISATVGFGLPITNNYNNRSIFNISAQWVHSSAKDLITENIFRLNIGLTFNERWFMKWKLD